MNGPAQGSLQKGLRLTGKWTKGCWTVTSVLGVGANGAVYSVRREDGAMAAMKVCDTAGGVAFEWGLLEQMAKSNAAFPKPQCIDDSANHPALYFYVMEQIQGRPLSDVWHHLSPIDVKRVLLAIGFGLRDLHRAKHAFCDVKPQNLLVDLHKEQCVRFVDVGGVTPFGRSIRQFTPTSDGAYWGYGERRATAQYDIAAVALMVVCLENSPPPALGQWPIAKRKTWILRAVRQMPQRQLGAVLEQAILGQIPSAEAFVREVYGVTVREPARSKTQASKARPSAGWNKSTGSPGTSRNAGANRTSTAAGSKTGWNPGAKAAAAVHGGSSGRPRPDWSERLMWVSLICATLSTASAWAVYLHGL